MKTKYQATTHCSLQCGFCLQSLVLTLTVYLKFRESCKHSLDHIRVCMVTSTFASAMTTPASGKGTSIVCFIYFMLWLEMCDFAGIIFRRIGRQRAKCWQIQAKYTTIVMLKMELAITNGKKGKVASPKCLFYCHSN